MSALDIKNLSYIYNQGTDLEKIAVNNVNLSINDGEIIGIIGHTGSGKSTFAQMLSGTVKPTAGKIFLYGKDIWKDYKNRKEVYFKVGLVFQYPEKQLFAQTVYEDIAFGPKNQGFSEGETEEKVFEALDFVNIDKKLLNRSPFELSGGEKRRVAIAGIFAMNPGVLILDEPTSGLDPISREKIINNILSYHSKKRGAVIFISHFMEETARISDRVAIMDRGKIKMVDTPENVFYDYKSLKSINLDAPQITKIVSNIHSKGYNINKKIVTVEKGTQEILRLLRE
ncbi:MAG: energy-coupling factor transporter ATPase [Oscillospiraceae bacterium]|jgi:energy-coupling factor transport system ATP-binding protein|nr:energy-coupling factor transporter ATPase [Oscillospiraceae bacterium]